MYWLPLRINQICMYVGKEYFYHQASGDDAQKFHDVHKGGYIVHTDHLDSRGAL